MGPCPASPPASRGLSVCPEVSCLNSPSLKRVEVYEGLPQKLLHSFVHVTALSWNLSPVFGAWVRAHPHLETSLTSAAPEPHLLWAQRVMLTIRHCPHQVIFCPLGCRRQKRTVNCENVLTRDIEEPSLCGQ